MGNDREATTQLAYEAFFIARQPIFNRAKNIYGYELLFRHSATAIRAAIPDEEVASSKVLVDGFSIAANNIAGEKRFFVNFPRTMLVGEAATTLPPERCVIEILERVPPDEMVLNSCRKLREAGYLLALDDYAAQPVLEAFLSEVDLVKVDIRELPRDQWGVVLDRLRLNGVRALAEKVEQWDEFQYLHELGYDLFQGFFFSRPEIVQGRKLPSGLLAKVKLLKLLSNPAANLEDIPEIVASDPGLSLRLLRFINSAAFGLRSKINSIPHAVAMLGLQPIRRWAMIVIISDLDGSFKGVELTYISLQRARFFELLSGLVGSAPHGPQSMFMLGLLSKVDAMLGQPMGDVVGGLPLEPELLEALCGNTSKGLEWLQMVETMERGNWHEASVIISRWGVSGPLAAKSYLDASTWAGEKIWAL
ncbi:MAG: HDOD domain-containing protein [Desulfovibrionaceae bacterium]